ncbi:MAG: hypothetical protein NVS9B15_00790 [Acidobacteriaceae bacterium]
MVMAAIAAFTQVRTASADDGVGGQWLLERHGNEGVQFTLRYRSENNGFGFHSMSESFDTALNKLKGLDMAALNSSGTKSQFELVRDAGTFKCEGWFEAGSASGHWTFAPTAQYASALSQKGVGAPDAQQQMRLAMADASLELVDVLKKAGYEFDVEKLIKTVNHGVGLEYVRGMADLGYKPETLDGLIKMRDHGVDPKYVRELMAAGLGHLSAEEVVKIRDHGVDAEYIHGLARHGITGLDGQQLAKLRDHGVDPDFIAGMKASGVNASPEEWIRLRDHGVNPEYVKEVHESGVDVSSEELIRLRDHGVDAGYVKALRAAGMRVSTEELIRLRDHGVSSVLISEVRQAGFKDLSAESYIDLAAHGVSADYLRQFGKGHSVSEVIRMHDMGVSASM